jgi:hypothetical protein
VYNHSLRNYPTYLSRPLTYIFGFGFIVYIVLTVNLEVEFGAREITSFGWIASIALGIQALILVSYIKYVYVP